MFTLARRRGDSFYRPWSIQELNSLLASARTMPGELCGLLAADWWHAFLLVLLNTGAAIRDVLQCHPDHYDRRNGTLELGAFVYRLDPLTISAIERIYEYRDELFPWATDDPKRRNHPRHMLLREYRTVLYRAGLPHTTRNLFERVRQTSKDFDFSKIDVNFRFIPRDGKPQLTRAIERRRRQARVLKLRESEKQFMGDEGTLLWFFETYYRPRKLAKSAKASAAVHRGAINRFNEFLGRVARLTDLTDDTLERFGLHQLALGRSVATANNLLRTLLAEWRYAWQKRLIEQQPRGIEFFRGEKKAPKAWSLEEVGTILKHAKAQPGWTNGVRTGDLWLAFLLLLYETGLRFRAALQLRTADVNWQTGVLLVPASIQKQRADQAFALHPETLAALRATLPEQRSKLFPFPYFKRLRAHYRDLLRQANLPHGPDDLFHKLRRTCATHLSNMWGEKAAQKQLGHSDVQLTLTSYIDPTKLSKLWQSNQVPRPDWK